MKAQLHVAVNLLRRVVGNRIDGSDCVIVPCGFRFFIQHAQEGQEF